MARRSLLEVGAIALVTMAGCASNVAPDEHVGSDEQPIIKGSTSTIDQDSVVFIAVDDKGTSIPACSGSLIARNLVLTAHHCVSMLSEDEKSVTADFRPDVLQIFNGRDAPKQIVNGDSPSATGTKTFAPPPSSLYPDIGLIVLDRSVTGPIATLRLEGGAKKGETLTVVGFGLTESNLLPAQRMQRTGVTVIDIYPGSATTTEPLNPFEFTFGEAACSGDSGGPAFDAKTKAIVGVASRVGNGKNPTDTDPSAFCVGSNAVDVYTGLEAAKDLIAQAFAAAGATPTLEPQDTPSGGADPSANGAGGGTSPPARPQLKQPSDSSCSATGAIGTGTSRSAWALAAAVLGAAVARRRRSERDFTGRSGRRKIL